MVKECLGNRGSIQKCKCPGVTVPFLQRCDAFLRDIGIQTLVVFPDAIMCILVIVFLKIDALVTVEFLKGLNLMYFRLTQERIHNLVELLTLALGFSASYGGMADGNPKLRQREFQLLCNILASIVEIIPISE